MPENSSYRICIIDDFRNSKTVYEHRTYGILEIDRCFTVGGPYKHQVAADSIRVFINYELALESKVRQEVYGFVRGALESHLEAAPVLEYIK